MQRHFSLALSALILLGTTLSAPAQKFQPKTIQPRNGSRTA
jgi:hypothetical protein